MVMCKTEAREERGGDCFFKSFDLKLVSSKLPIHPFVDLTKQLVQPIPFPFYALDRRVGTLCPVNAQHSDRDAPHNYDSQRS